MRRLILFAAVYFSTRLSLEPPIEPKPNDSVRKIEPEAASTPIAEPEERNKSVDIDKTRTEKPKSSITPLVLPQRDGVARIPVIRVTIEVDENAKGKITAYRGFSTLALPFFRGTSFESRLFQKAQFFHGEDGLGRATFADGDMSTTVSGSSPFGWKLWRSGCSYNRRQGSVRFSRMFDGSTGRSGFTIGKAGELPCQFTYEVTEADDRLPVLEIAMYPNDENGVKIATISCWGHKEKDERLRLGASFTCPATMKDRVLIVDDAVVKEQQTFSHDFQLPSGIVGKVKMIEYDLTVDETGGTTPTAGYDLTLVDIVGRMKGKAGFRIEKRDDKSVVRSVDRDGPAFSTLHEGDEIVSINGQNDPGEHSAILDSLHFGDPVTVRYVPMGAGGSMTSLFHAE